MRCGQELFKLQGFTPAELLLGFQPRTGPAPLGVGDIIMGELMESLAGGDRGDEEILASVIYEDRLSRLDEVRQLAKSKRIQEQKKQMEKDVIKLEAFKPRVGDLVLLRRYAIDTQRGKKL
jgi:hypothetical protein